MHANIPLSKLLASRRNPRKVRPQREAHSRLVASIKAHGLLEPLVVRPENGHFRVVAGNRRLEALRAVHQQDGKVPVPCVVRKVDAEEAEELSLTENFTREAMHPLDEAEAFSRLASVDRKGVNAIAAEFGVTGRYVRQRMKLAGLCEVVKAAYRSGQIDTGTAEAFAAVPPARQEEAWTECGGSPRHPQHVRNLIEDRWIDATHALFDLESVPAEAVSTDLFRESVLIERGAFMQAQAQALEAERHRHIEDGWSEVVIGDRSQVQGRLYAMTEPEPEFTKAERSRLDKLQTRHQDLEGGSGDDDAGEQDEQRAAAELEAIEEEVEAICTAAQGRYPEETKSRGTLFLTLSADGSVERQYRVARQEGSGRQDGSTGAGVGSEVPPTPPTANDLSDRQRAALHAHEAIAVRQAVLDGPEIVRKRVLVLALHEKVRTDAVAVRADVNATTLHADTAEAFQSETFVALRKQRGTIDPFQAEGLGIDEEEAYAKLCKLPEKTLDRLIAILIADCLTGHAQRETPLLGVLSKELAVSVRKHWAPDEHWLSGYQKIQLADLIGTLKGPAHGSAALKRKKSELVEELAALFSHAAAQPNGFEDQKLAERTNAWMPPREVD